MKLCANGHEIGTDDTCRWCKSSNRRKQYWKDNYEHLKQCSIKNMKGLNSDIAREKRAIYFSSELHRSRVAATGKRLAEERRNGLRPRLTSTRTFNTKPELTTRQVLEELGLNFIPQYQIGPYHFDFGLPGHKILIEIQGEYWHSLQNNIANDLAKESYVRSQLSDHKIIYISEIDAYKKGKIEQIITDSLGIVQTQRSFDVNEITVGAVDSAIALDFLAKRHYLPRFRKSMKCVHGIFLKDELIGILVYASPSYDTISTRHGLAARHVLELSRLVVKNDCHVKNLISKAMSLSVKLLKQQCDDVYLLVSYADQHFGHDGSVYKSCNWTPDGETKPSYYYASPDGSILHKKTVWDHAHKMKSTEDAYAMINDLKRVDTEPKMRFLYWLRVPLAITKKDCALTHAVKCLNCNIDAVTSTKALYRAKRKHGGYLCLSCSIQRNWQNGAYKNRPKRTEVDKKIKVDVTCKCGNKNSIQQKSLDGVIRKHGEYKCMGCIVRNSHANGAYKHLKRS
jgi:very-short-patch-repair endonuclease